MPPIFTRIPKARATVTSHTAAVDSDAPTTPRIRPTLFLACQGPLRASRSETAELFLETVSQGYGSHPNGGADDPIGGLVDGDALSAFSVDLATIRRTISSGSVDRGVSFLKERTIP